MYSWEMSDSNQRHPLCKSGATTAELISHTPPTRFELVTWKLTVSRATAAPQGNEGRRALGSTAGSLPQSGIGDSNP